MISFTQEQLNGWLGQFLWPFVRLLALMSTAPLFSDSIIPARVKVGLAALLAISISPSLPPMPAVAPASYAGVWLLGQQVLIGVTLGLCMRVVFAAVQTAGEFVGLQMGLSFASLFDPATGANTAVLSRLFNIVAMLVFFALDGHLLLLGALIRTFQTLPVALMQLDANGVGVYLKWGETVFVSGLLLALPLIASLLTINLAMGILNRASPQLSIFSVGFPISLIIGITLITVVLPNTQPFLESLFERGFETMSRVTDGLAGR
jgi:flagellar biosynthetic protein FliR